jgi:antitoxin ParD1/3/4
MNVSLTPRLEAMIREKVESGLYNNSSEVVREALRLMERRDREQQLRAALNVGLDDLARGDIVPWTPEFMEQLNREADEEDRLGLPISSDVTP